MSYGRVKKVGDGALNDTEKQMDRILSEVLSSDAQWVMEELPGAERIHAIAANTVEIAGGSQAVVLVFPFRLRNSILKGKAHNKLVEELQKKFTYVIPCNPSIPSPHKSIN